MKRVCYYFCFLLTLTAHRLSAATQPIATVFTETATVQSIFTILTFPARIESKVNAIVRSEADGAVSSILKPLGSRVRAGETVALVKHTDPVYEYAPLAVVSTVRGVVNEVHVTDGSLVNKGDPVVTVTDPAQLRVMIEVAAGDLGFIKAGLKGSLYIPGVAKPISSQVRGVSPSIDPMLGTATSELQVLGKDQKLIVSGMVGRVQFRVNEHRGFLLPDYAIVYRGDDAFVRIVKDGKAFKTPVKLGEHTQGQVEVSEGLKAGDVVVERTSRFVPDGSPVLVETAHE